MTVKEFKRLVSKIPNSQDDWIVVLSKDEEGNGFKELYCINNDNEKKCFQYFDEPSNELCSYNEDDFESFEEFETHVNDYEHLKPCIVLWP